MTNQFILVLVLWTVTLCGWTARLWFLTKRLQDLELENRKLKWWIRHSQSEEHRRERL